MESVRVIFLLKFVYTHTQYALPAPFPGKFFLATPLLGFNLKRELLLHGWQSDDNESGRRKGRKAGEYGRKHLAYYNVYYYIFNMLLLRIPCGCEFPHRWMNWQKNILLLCLCGESIRVIGVLCRNARKVSIAPQAQFRVQISGWWTLVNGRKTNPTFRDHNVW